MSPIHRLPSALPLGALLLVLLVFLGSSPDAQRISQLPQPAPPPPPASDGVALQAGNAVVTLHELNRSLREELSKQANTTSAQDKLLLQRIVRQLILDHLEPQAGEELGLDPRQVDLILSSQAEDERKEKGVLGYVGGLEASGLDAFSAEQANREDLFRVLWRRSVLGLGVADQRPTVDRFVRPGQLRALYREKQDELAPAKVRFQLLMVSSRAVGGPEQALAFCEEARQRIEAGEDFAQLVEIYGADLRETGGLTPLIPVPALPDQRMVAIAQGPLGVLSEPMPIFGKSGPDPEVGYQLCRLDSREEAPPRRFDDPLVQIQLRSYVTNVRDSRLLALEQERLGVNAFVWVNPALEGVGPASR